MKEGRKTTTRIAIILILMAIFFLPALGYSTLQQPHVTDNNIACADCHWTSSSAQPPWQNVSVPPGKEQDYTLNNKRCYRCHAPNTQGFPVAETHSSLTTGSIKWDGRWTTECVDCHSAHQQRQYNRWRLSDPNVFIVTGPFTVSGVGPYDSQNNRTLITLSSPLNDEYEGYYFIPDMRSPPLYKILSSTKDKNQFYVRGSVITTQVRGNGFAIIYGKSIKDFTTYRNPGGQTLSGDVKLFRPGFNVPGGFIDSNNYSLSLCQKCHTTTSNFTGSNPNHATTISPGSSCLNPAVGCHQTHVQGFKTSGAACGDCHGVPPSDINTMVRQIKRNNQMIQTTTGVTEPGAHVKHTNTAQQAFSRRQVGCMECHNTGMILPQTTDPDIGDYKIQIGINATDIGYKGATYDGRASLLNNFTYEADPNTTVTTNGSLTCSSVYCHGSTIGGTNPTWTGSVTCGNCHKATEADPPTLGSHVMHAGNASTMQSAVACSQCHGHSGIGSTVHVDGSAQWALNTGNPLIGSLATYRNSNAGKVAPVPSTPYGQCSNIYCHSNAAPLGGTDIFQTVTWGGSPMACNSCHSSPADASPTWSVSHTKHVKTYTQFTCNHCHSTVASNNTTISDKTKHVNALKEVAFNSFNPLGSYNSQNHTCSNLYCHSNAEPRGGTNIYATITWNTSVDCGSCHSAQGSPSPTWSPPHTKHINTYNANPNFTCNACHSLVASDNTTLSDRSRHVNAQKDINFNTFASTLATWNPTTAQCSNTYCHSAGTGGTSQPEDTRPISQNTATWSGTVTCGSCHGIGTTTGIPNYANNSPKANSHAKHPVDCSICHVGTTADGSTITDVTKHVNKVYDLQAKTGFSFIYTYNAQGGSCSNISCHFNQTAQWGQVLTCNSCHASPPNTGAHIVHSGALDYTTSQYGKDTSSSTAGAYGFNCGNCHPLDNSYHANGTIEIELYNPSATGFKARNPSTASKIGSGNNTQCNNVYCHSNGADSTNRAYRETPLWGSTFGANKCGSCHDNPPQYAGQSHYTASGYMGKEGGHLVGIHFDNIYTGETGLAQPGTDPTNSHGNSLYSTTISCYICHSSVVSSTTIDTYALYNVQSSVMKCANCHTATTPTPLQNGVIANKSLHINAEKDIALVDNFTMKSKAQLRDDSKPSLWTRNGGYKVQDAYDSAIINSSDWDPQTKTCTTACHNNQPVQWGASITCISCHTDL